MTNKLKKIFKKISLAFVMLYGLNLILSGVNILIPINLITITSISLLGTPGILGLVAIYFLI